MSEQTKKQQVSPKDTTEVIEGKTLELQTQTLPAPKIKPIFRWGGKSAAQDPNLSINDMLAGARKWLRAPDSYMIRNMETGCWGLASRKPSGGRAAITIAHAAGCNCLDVRLMHICDHVGKLVKRGLVAKRFRNDLVIVIKTRTKLAQNLPEQTRFPRIHRGWRKAIVRPQEEIDAEDKVRRVVDSHENQVLIENWKNLEVFKMRRIWLDW
ncbi:hypothetical protein GGS20DRAFT_536480 [Poronia punctata]|nr:hypothetical protein GGS20DRAFT_536480 [Poronia punctata]